MGDRPGRAAPVLLGYRPWQGTFRPPMHSVWPITRTALWLVLRRKLFWGLYALGMLVFLMFFFGQYLAAFSDTLATRPQSGGTLRRLIHRFISFLDGSGETYRTFIHYQGYIVMIILALSGSVIIGDDLRLGSLPFYLSKPLGRWHYLLGKGLAIVAIISLMTTLPALVLFIEFGTLYSWRYLTTQGQLVLGILGYGGILAVTLTLVLLAFAVWLRRTVPLLMVWTTLFLFCRVLASTLVSTDRLNLDRHWRLIDLWNNAYLVGSACLGMAGDVPKPDTQPDWQTAGLVLLGVCLSCLTYLILRIRAVEVVR